MRIFCLRSPPELRKTSGMFIRICFIILLALSVVPAAQAESYQEWAGDRKPLMVIRFNQPNVYYQLPLYRAVKKTLSVYPTAYFEVVAVAPTTGEFFSDKEEVGKASEYAGLVTTTLKDMGLPNGRFRTIYAGDSTLQDNEIRIFVR